MSTLAFRKSDLTKTHVITATTIGTALECYDLQVFDQSPVLRRPRPDLSTLMQPNPALKSIVTSPPLFTEASANGAGMSAV